jgi:hypothetical protein
MGTAQGKKRKQRLTVDAANNPQPLAARPSLYANLRLASFILGKPAF